jgi:hypothetical protein
MRAPPGSPDWLQAFTAAERPDLWESSRLERVFARVWPEYNLHGNQTDRYFGALFPRYADFQVLFVDRRSDRLVARGRTIPLHWDRTIEDLPAGIDAAGIRAIEDGRRSTCLTALAAEVLSEYQGTGLSGLVIEAMRTAAKQADLDCVIAPVRPSLKDRYPLIPIERYSAWQDGRGLPFDPWMRVHARLGARILRPEPRSMEIHAPVADWESWTQMSFPDEGTYVFPGGLAPLEVSAGPDGNVGSYWEPNVWMLHEVDR